MKKSKVEKHKGNKYRKFSVKGSVEGEMKMTGKSYGQCFACQCCQSSRVKTNEGKEKINLCYNCYFGYNNHQKLSTPKI